MIYRTFQPFKTFNLSNRICMPHALDASSLSHRLSTSAPRTTSTSVDILTSPIGDTASLHGQH